MANVLLLLPEELVVSCPTDGTHQGFGWSSRGSTGKLCPYHASLPHSPRTLIFPNLSTQRGLGLPPCTWGFRPVILFCHTLCLSQTLPSSWRCKIHFPSLEDWTRWLNCLDAFWEIELPQGRTGLKPTRASWRFESEVGFSLTCGLMIGKLLHLSEPS